MADILDGKKLAYEIKQGVKKEVEALNASGIDVGLGLMLIGDDPASLLYYKTTLGTCRMVGIKTYEFRMPKTSSRNELLNAVHAVNNDERIHGLLLLMPLPQRINARKVINAIAPEKDIDGLGAIAVGRLAADESTLQLFNQGSVNKPVQAMLTSFINSFLPCTPFGVIRLLDYYNIQIKGRHAVVIGKSLAVGKPLSMMLLAKEATVTVCHKETEDIEAFTRQADILCSATGRAGLIKGEMVKEGAVVVDIGINMLKDGTIIGDIDFASVA
ncbi:MAG: bifunctional 5,10-methylene-tetrahydrofolate dehydrogenase/5,10-methylene-tetrahydrofolate cyclohydrolase, partial [Nitrospiraceae bacterium]|nr:bifunctional 5,10-methylene-tetrahydrofolate dehydrogenase/5,10-methylene-tetrahydrofolate cyclohydrolase [Nitrospiraceae bacterium]